MLIRKNKAASISHMDGIHRTAWSFRRRPPFEAYRPVEYRLHPKIRERIMYPVLSLWVMNTPCHEQCSTLNLLRSRLLAIGLQTMVDLEQQRLHHRDAIHRLAARRKADRGDMIKLVEAENRNLDALLEEHRETCQLVDAFEKGENS